MSKPTDEAAVVSTPRHVLPKDLPNAIKHLSDEELDRLITAALAEMRQRGRRLPTDKHAPKIKPGLARPLDSWSIERRSRCIQGGRHAFAHCSPVRLIPIGRAQGFGGRSFGRGSTATA